MMRPIPASPPSFLPPSSSYDAHLHCPIHRIPLARIVRDVVGSSACCDSCAGTGAAIVLGCPQAACGYGVCKWCYIGGRRLFVLAAQLGSEVEELREEIARVKARVDGDLFIWV
jgi:hypothetical protein